MDFGLDFFRLVVNWFIIFIMKVDIFFFLGNSFDVIFCLFCEIVGICLIVFFNVCILGVLVIFEVEKLIRVGLV